MFSSLLFIFDLPILIIDLGLTSAYSLNDGSNKHFKSYLMNLLDIPLYFVILKGMRVAEDGRIQIALFSNINVDMTLRPTLSSYRIR